MSIKLRLGTRGSKLALAQAHRLKAEILLRAVDAEIEIVIVRTSGDKGDRDARGAFVKEIQEALLAHEVDLALHCLKDLPTQGVDGLMLAAHLEREDPRDAIILRKGSWRDLAVGSVVGTGSVRRTSQLSAFRPDLSFKPLMGNVDTRLRKLNEGEYDAIVLAIAGLKRLGLVDQWHSHPETAPVLEILDPEVMLPCPGQAVLTIETREDDESARRVADLFEHPPTRAQATAERSFLSAFGGGCSVPVAALAISEEQELRLQGLVASPDGTQILRGARSGPDPNLLGAELAQALVSQGAQKLFQARWPAGALPNQVSETGVHA